MYLSTKVAHLGPSANVWPPADEPLVRLRSLSLLFHLAFICRAGPIPVTLSHQNLRMYSPEQTKKLQQQTNNLLAASKTHHLEKNKLEELKDVLRFHEYRYAIMNDPLI